MSHLSTDQLAELRVELERQLARLERSMKVTDEAIRPVELDQTAVGRLSRMDSLQNQAMTKGLRERETVKLVQLKGALVRMSEGDYGQCTLCGSDIPIERLFVFPEAPVCGPCGSDT